MVEIDTVNGEKYTLVKVQNDSVFFTTMKRVVYNFSRTNTAFHGISSRLEFQ